MVPTADRSPVREETPVEVARPVKILPLASRATALLLLTREPVPILELYPSRDADRTDELAGLTVYRLPPE